MLAHLGGAPVEEMASLLAMSAAGAVVSIRVWFGRWRPTRSRRP